MNINELIEELTEEQIDAIFEQLNNDEKLNKQLEKIANNPRLNKEAKKLLTKYRLDLAFGKLSSKYLEEVYANKKPPQPKAMPKGDEYWC